MKRFFSTDLSGQNFTQVVLRDIIKSNDINQDMFLWHGISILRCKTDSSYPNHEKGLARDEEKQL